MFLPGKNGGECEGCGDNIPQITYDKTLDDCPQRGGAKTTFCLQDNTTVQRLSVRQVGEAIKILHTGDNILNSKCEYIFNCIYRLTILEGYWGKRKSEREKNKRRKKEEK